MNALTFEDQTQKRYVNVFWWELTQKYFLTGDLDGVEFCDCVGTDRLGEHWVGCPVQQVPHIYAPVRLGDEEDACSGGTPPSMSQLAVVALRLHQRLLHVHKLSFMRQQIATRDRNYNMRQFVKKRQFVRSDDS